MIPQKNRWLHTLQPVKNPNGRIFCLPYAGGSASTYSNWQKHLPSNMEVCAIQLPGRGERLNEPLLTQLDEIVNSVITAITPYLDQCDYYLYGHSMGARIAYEIACTLDKGGHKLPKSLLLSGAEAPQTPLRKKAIHALPDDEFLLEVKELNGTPKELWEHKELMELTIPVLRADFKVCETWENEARHTLNIPIQVFGGTDDPEVFLEELDAWEACTSSSFNRHLIPGDHFFINDKKEEILKLVSSHIETHKKNLTPQPQY